MVEETLSGSEPGRRRSRILRWIKIGGPSLLAVVAIYYLGGALWLNHVDDDLGFGLQSPVPKGGAKSVAVAADLIDREINAHRWVANDPWFMPGAVLDDMPNFRWGSSPLFHASRSNSAIRSRAPAARARSIRTWMPPRAS